MAARAATSEAFDADAEDAADAEAIAEFEAVGGIPHEAMKAWLLSWGTDDELPPPSHEL